MPDCRMLETCPFLNGKLGKMRGTAELFRRTYCRTNPEKCARMMVSKMLGDEKIPAGLFPNQNDRAVKLISDNLATH